MSDEASATTGDDRVEIDDPFEIPDEVDDAWEEDEVDDGEAPSG